MRRRKKFITEERAQNVVVIAVWLGGLEVYDAYDIACYLRMDHPEQHLDEFLLHGTISADSYRILAMFRDNLELEDGRCLPQAGDLMPVSLEALLTPQKKIPSTRALSEIQQRISRMKHTLRSVDAAR